MNKRDLKLDKLSEGFKLSCQAEGLSPKTIDWYTTFPTRFRQFLD